MILFAVCPNGRPVKSAQRSFQGTIISSVMWITSTARNLSATYAVINTLLRILKNTWWASTQTKTDPDFSVQSILENLIWACYSMILFAVCPNGRPVKSAQRSFQGTIISSVMWITSMARNLSATYVVINTLLRILKNTWASTRTKTDPERFSVLPAVKPS